MADWDAGLRAINVSDPANLHEVGFYDTQGRAQGVAVANGHAYLADGWHGLRVISVSDPTHPVEVGAYYTETFPTGEARDVTVVDGYAYVIDEKYEGSSRDGLWIIDVRDPANPKKVGFHNTPGVASRVSVVGDFAYVADGPGGVRVISMADKAHPQEIASFDTPGYARDVGVMGDYVYVADGGGGLVILRMIIELPHHIYLPFVARNH